MKVVLTSAMALGIIVLCGVNQPVLAYHHHHGYGYGYGWGYPAPVYVDPYGSSYYGDPYYYNEPVLRVGPVELF